MTEYPNFSNSQSENKTRLDEASKKTFHLSEAASPAWFWAALGLLGLAVTGQIYLIFAILSLVNQESSLASQITSWKEGESARGDLIQRWGAIETSVRDKSQSKQEQIAVLEGVISAKQAEYQEVLSDLASEQEALGVVRRNAAELQKQISASEEKARLALVAASEADFKKSQLMQEITVLETQRAEAVAAESKLQISVAMLESQRDELNQSTTTKQALVAQLEQRLTNTRAQLNEIEDDVSERLQLTARSETLKELVKSLETTKSTSETRLAELQGRVDMADQNAVDANKRLADTRNQVTLAQDLIISRQQDLERLDAQIAQKMTSLRQHQQAEQALTTELATAAQKLRDLSSMSVTALTEVNENAAESLKQMAEQSRQSLITIEILQEIQRQITTAAKQSAAQAEQAEEQKKESEQIENQLDSQTSDGERSTTGEEQTSGGNF